MKSLLGETENAHIWMQLGAEDLRAIGLIHYMRQFSKLRAVPRHVYVADAGVVYVDIPKAACTTIRASLAEMLCLTNLDSLHDPMAFPRLKTPSEFNDKYVFTFVRSPVARLISCFSEKIRDKSLTDRNFTHGVSNAIRRFGFSANMEFPDFVRLIADIPDEEADNHFKSMTAILAHGGSISQRPDFVGKVESFYDDAEKLKVISGIRLTQTAGEPRNVASQQKGFLNAKIDITGLEDVIYRRYEKDFVEFQYTL